MAGERGIIRRHEAADVAAPSTGKSKPGTKHCRGEIAVYGLAMGRGNYLHTCGQRMQSWRAKLKTAEFNRCGVCRDLSTEIPMR